MARLEFTLDEAVEMLIQNVKLPHYIKLSVIDSKIVVKAFAMTAYVSYKDFVNGTVYFKVKGKGVSQILLLLLCLIRKQQSDIFEIGQGYIGIHLKNYVNKQLRGVYVEKIEHQGDMLVFTFNTYLGEEILVK